MQKLWNNLQNGLKKHLDNNGFGKVIIGLSGGLDSSVVTAIASEEYKKQIKKKEAEREALEAEIDRIIQEEGSTEGDTPDVEYENVAKWVSQYILKISEAKRFENKAVSLIEKEIDGWNA